MVLVALKELRGQYPEEVWCLMLENEERAEHDMLRILAFIP